MTNEPVEVDREWLMSAPVARRCPACGAERMVQWSHPSSARVHLGCDVCGETYWKRELATIEALTEEEA